MYPAEKMKHFWNAAQPVLSILYCTLMPDVQNDP